MEINLSVSQICAALGINAPEKQATHIIRHIASLESAGPEDCAVVFERGDASVFSSIDKEKIQNSRAGIILAREFLSYEESVNTTKFLIVPHVINAVTTLVQLAQSLHKNKQLAATIDPTAHIHSSAIIGSATIIGPRVRIDAGVIVGDNCSIDADTHLHPHVTVLDHCSIGKRTIIHSGTVIGSDGFGFSVTNNGLVKLPHLGGVMIGDDVEIGANCAIDRALFDQTILGNGVKLDNLVHIAHNVHVGQHTAIIAQTGIAGGVVIGQGCQIGGQVAIKDHVVIGNGVKIVSKSAVIDNIADGITVAGQPARPFSQWKRELVSIRMLPDLIKQVRSAFAVQKKPTSIFQAIKKLFWKS